MKLAYATALVCTGLGFGCHLDDSNPAQPPGDAGPASGSDAAPPPPPPPPGCTAEANAAFCARLGANCGEVSADDNCGTPRTAACGTCAMDTTCGASNVCGCEPETDAELCSANMAACGSITATDRCGAVRTLACADTCTGGATCGGGWVANSCGSTTCTADGWCRPTTQAISQYFDFNAVWAATASAAWAAGYGDVAGGGKAYRWNGTVWRAVATTNRGLYAIAGTSASDVWIAGGYGFTWHYDGGTTLTSGTAGCFDCDVFDLWSVGPQDVWGIGYDQKAMHFEGSGWGVTDLYPAPAAPRAVWAAATNDVWVAGDAGSMRHWNGLDWTATTVGTTYFHDLWGSGPSDIWAVGDGGAILHYTGTGWSAVASGTTQKLRAITGTDAHHVWFAGDSGVMLFWNGSTLTAQQSGTTRAINSLWALAPNDVWAVGSAGLLLHRGA